MDKITLLTVFTSLALYHILMGLALLATLTVLIKLFKPSAELQSWLWITAFFVATCLPMTLFINDLPEPRYQALERTGNPSESGNPGTTSVTFIKKTDPLDIQWLQVDAHQGEYYWNIPSRFIFQTSVLIGAFLWIWLFGTIWRTVIVARSVWQSQQLIKDSAPFQIPESFKPWLHVDVLYSSKATSPMVIGVFKQRIILPVSVAEQLSQQQLQAIILHEQAHIDRFDLWIGLAQKTIATLFWWSPVLRMLDKRIHIARELACDARAAKTLNSGKQYAQSLLDCARLMITQHQHMLAMGLFNKKKELTHRVEEVLEMNNQKTSHPLWIILACIGLSVCSLQAAQIVAPKVNFAKVKQEAKPYHYLPLNQAESLKAAVENRDIKAISLLIDKGVDINRPIQGDGTALIIAARRGDLTFVEDLISIGADVNQAARGDGNPLIQAAMRNHIDIAKVLIANGASLDAVVIGDETPLINAAWQGHLEMTQLLVEQGADVNLSVRAMAWDGWQLRSPLNMASTQQVKDYLTSQGATQ